MRIGLGCKTIHGNNKISIFAIQAFTQLALEGSLCDNKRRRIQGNSVPVGWHSVSHQ